MKQLLARAVESFGEAAMHEAELLDGHLFALQERFAVARRARDVGELVRNQFDLLPATQARLRRDYRSRRELWRRLRRQLLSAKSR